MATGNSEDAFLKEIFTDVSVKHEPGVVRKPPLHALVNREQSTAVWKCQSGRNLFCTTKKTQGFGWHRKRGYEIWYSTGPFVQGKGFKLPEYIQCNKVQSVKSFSPPDFPGLIVPCQPVSVRCNGIWSPFASVINKKRSGQSVNCSAFSFSGWRDQCA